MPHKIHWLLDFLIILSWTHSHIFESYSFVKSMWDEKLGKKKKKVNKTKLQVPFYLSFRFVFPCILSLWLICSRAQSKDTKTRRVSLVSFCRLSSVSFCLSEKKDVDHSVEQLYVQSRYVSFNMAQAIVNSICLMARKL